MVEKNNQSRTPVAVIDLQVPFYDVDAYRVVWHGNYARYFEVARCKLLDELGISYEHMEAAGYFFPIVDMGVKYVKPLTFGQKVKVQAQLKAWDHKLIIAYVITDAETGERLTRGHTHQIAISIADQVTHYQLPASFIEIIEAYCDNASR